MYLVALTKMSFIIDIDCYVFQWHSFNMHTHQPCSWQECPYSESDKTVMATDKRPDMGPRKSCYTRDVH